MDVAGNNSETREFSGFMEDDEPKMGYRRERIPPAENVLSRKTLLLPCSNRSNIRSDDHRLQHERIMPVSPINVGGELFINIQC